MDLIFINPFFENKLLKEYIEFINEPIKINITIIN